MSWGGAPRNGSPWYAKPGQQHPQRPAKPCHVMGGSVTRCRGERLDNMTKEVSWARAELLIGSDRNAQQKVWRSCSLKHVIPWWFHVVIIVSGKLVDIFSAIIIYHELFISYCWNLVEQSLSSNHRQATEAKSSSHWWRHEAELGGCLEEKSMVTCHGLPW